MPKHAFTYREFITRFADDEACRAYLVKVLWNGKPRCPHCGFRKKIYTYTNRPVYKCGNCNSQFRVTTGTIFESTKLPLADWFYAIKLMACSKKGISSIQLSKELGITQKSAWFMEHNIRTMLGNKNYRDMLGGIVEVDETYIGGRKKGGKRGRGTGKLKVFGMIERNSEDSISQIRMFVVDNVSGYTLKPIIFDHIEIGSVLMSDEWKAYNGLDEYFERGVVNHGTFQYGDGDNHVNSIESAWGLLKRMLKGTYHRQSAKHIEKYCKEFAFRFNNRDKTVALLFKEAIKQSKIRVKHAEITKM